MKTKDTQYYCTLFNKLRRDYSFGGAPHKPILLISLIQAFRQGLYKSSKIAITPEIVGLFKDNWTKLVVTKHQCRFALPFFHMKSEPFWELVPKEGLGIVTNAKGSINSFSSLTNAVDYAQVDEELAALLCEEESAQIIVGVHFGREARQPQAGVKTLPKRGFERSRRPIRKNIIHVKFFPHFLG